MSEDFLSFGDAARALTLTKARISQLAAEGKLEVRFIGGRKMVSATSVQSYLHTKRRPGRLSRGESGTPFVLMSADYPVARITYDSNRQQPFDVIEVVDVARMPMGITTAPSVAQRRQFNDWWQHRSIPHARPQLDERLAQLGLDSSWEIPVLSLGLSLSDCYWLQPADRDDLAWDNLNYFENDFIATAPSASAGWVSNVGLDTPDNTSEGELPKRWIVDRGERVLLKGSGIDDQRPVNEVVATALHRRLLEDGAYVPYQLVQLASGLACRCPCFVSNREEFIPAASMRRLISATRGKTAYERTCRCAEQLGCEPGAMNEALSRMIVCDAIVANSDRHWRNFGLIRSVDTLAVRPAPLFDSGNSLWYSYPTERVAQRDWSYASKPFDANPDRQLLLVDKTDWFDASKLDGFVVEAEEALRNSTHAGSSDRLAFILRGIERRIEVVENTMRVLRLQAR